MDTAEFENKEENIHVGPTRKTSHTLEVFADVSDVDGNHSAKKKKKKKSMDAAELENNGANVKDKKQKKKKHKHKSE